jgi:hypothetical protein
MSVKLLCTSREHQTRRINETNEENNKRYRKEPALLPSRGEINEHCCIEPNEFETLHLAGLKWKPKLCWCDSTSINAPGRSHLIADSNGTHALQGKIWF